MPYTYDHPRPAVTVDVVLCAPAARAMRVLLIQRGHAPFAGQWALPGGFLEMDEELEAGARREMREETSLDVGAVHELGAWGTVGRDPRGRTVSVVYLALCDDLPQAKAGDDARAAAWHSLRRPPPVAFDHREVLRAARARLRDLAARTVPLLELLPAPFTMATVHRVFEAAAGSAMTRSAVRSRVRRYVRRMGRQSYRV